MQGRRGNSRKEIPSSWVLDEEEEPSTKVAARRFDEMWGKAREKRHLCRRPHKWREEDKGEEEHASENLLSLDSEE
ncbi:hypothetical protein B296_00004145 [Ensete ventricosum]|uniref:Uncharacterized protein n=1 Tax=Ensete ventricosum TaxID=4639 RepID=A0A427ARY1_ENSVE|nr:hypothetical protein B296_00004145 [Ensete ventricosum]